jgi:5-formyltetrahydrofolate cyclo-ligase
MKMKINAEIITKNSIRQQMQHIASNITPQKLEAANKLISSSCYSVLRQQNVSSIFIYLSIQSEVNTHELVESLLKAKIDIYVPKLIENNKMVAARLCLSETLVKNNYKFLEPRTFQETASKVDIVVVPGVAFSEAGVRLGRGLGYYDRWLSENSYSRAIGLAYDHQILASVPASKHDINITEIITETRRIFCPSGKL